MDRARNQARSDDIKRLKTHAHFLRPKDDPFVPALYPHEKLTRGFCHPQIARLLCPITWLEDFDMDERCCYRHSWCHLISFFEASDSASLMASRGRNLMISPYFSSTKPRLTLIIFL
jgi:hypothetical protein